MENTFTYGITGNEAGMTVAEYLKSRGYSSRLVVRLRNTPGSFFVDGTAVFSTCVLKDGNQLQVRVAEKKSSAAVEPVPMDLDILYEDTHLLVVNKPAGMAVHPSQGNHGNTLANGLADYFRKKQEAFVFRAVNRLDKDTSGLLLVAKNGLSSSLLSGQVERREICREYLAAVCGKTDACGTVSVPIGRKEGSAIQRIPDPDHGEAAAIPFPGTFSTIPTSGTSAARPCIRSDFPFPIRSRERSWTFLLRCRRIWPACFQDRSFLLFPIPRQIQISLRPP